MSRKPPMRFALLTVAVLALGAFGAPAAGAHRATPRLKPSPVVFLERVITAIAANDYALAWQSLHAAHRAVAPEAEYVACEELSPIPGTLESLVPVRVLRKPVTVAGLPHAVQGVLVTFRLRLGDRELSAYATVTLNATAVPVGKRWAWMLPLARYEMYRDDACGA